MGAKQVFVDIKSILYWPFNQSAQVKFLLNARSEVAETGMIGANTTLKHAAIERNKRCMLTYLNHRAELLTAMR